MHVAFVEIFFFVFLY